MKEKFYFSVICLFVSTCLVLGFILNNNDPSTKSDRGKISIIKSAPYIEKGPALYSPLSSLLESFEGYTFPPAGWAKINVAPGATGWDLDSTGTTPVPGFNGGELFCPPGGGTHLAFCNYITGGTTSNDEWLCTPQLGNISPTDSLYFWIRKFGNYLDRIILRFLRLLKLPPSAYTVTVQLLTFQPTDSGYIHYAYGIGSLVTPGANIYIGWRQWVLDAINDGASFLLTLYRLLHQLE